MMLTMRMTMTTVIMIMMNMTMMMTMIMIVIMTMLELTPTQETCLYPDLHHPDNPLWLDTVGLDDADSMKNNSELVTSYLFKLKAAKVKWVHAVVWCITP